MYLWIKSCWNSSSRKWLTNKSNLASSKPDERLCLQELCVSWMTAIPTFDQWDVLNAITPGLQKVSANTNPESLLHPAITRKHTNPAFFFFSFSLFSHSFFWYAHTRERKPAKCLIHDSNITVKKPDERYLCLHGTGEMRTLWQAKMCANWLIYLRM